MSESQLQSLTKEQLKKICKQKGLKVTGNKPELIRAIIECRTEQLQSEVEKNPSNVMLPAFSLALSGSVGTKQGGSYKTKSKAS